MSGIDTVVLDLDGTLVDSVYVHVLAWQAAFAEVGVEAPAARIHRHIGMGGDRLVAEVAGQVVEDAIGDEVRARHAQQLDDLFGRIHPTEGAGVLLDSLRSHDFRVVLASSSDRALTERLLGLLEGGGDLLESVISGSDASESKPGGELIEVALESVDAERAVVIGDAVWDVRAAQAAGVPCIGLLSGGIAEAELRDAGAVAVYTSPADLAAHLQETGRLR